MNRKLDWLHKKYVEKQFEIACYYKNREYHWWKKFVGGFILSIIFALMFLNNVDLRFHNKMLISKNNEITIINYDKQKQIEELDFLCNQYKTISKNLLYKFTFTGSDKPIDIDDLTKTIYKQTWSRGL